MATSNSSWITIAERLGLSEEVLREILWQFSCDFRVAIPGIIRAFDATKQTVTVQLAIRENMIQNTPDGLGGMAPVSKATDIPEIVDVPIVLPRAGGFVTTLPINAGDECLVIFADMCMSAWWTSGDVQNQEVRRRHSLSDGFAVLGPWSQPRKISNYSTTAAELRSEDGTVKVSLESNRVTVTAPTVNVTATTQVNISGAGHVSIENKDFLTHQHTGVSTGGGNSGPVL